MKTFKAVSLLAVTVILAGCLNTDAQIVSRNLAKSAEQFEITRRVVFFNGITGEYMLELIGRCSLEDQRRQLEVTCKVGDGEFKKHHLGLSDNVSYFSEQLAGAEVSAYHYRVIFKPQTIVPDLDFKGSTSDIPRLQD